MFRHLRTGAVVAIAALVIVASTLPMQGANNTGILQGVVKDASGTPVSGAFVKMKNGEKRLTFMVVTQAQGRYRANHLPPGEYVVQGIGKGFQSKLSAAVEVTDGQAATVDLSLTDPQAAYVPGRDSGGARGGRREGGGGGQAAASSLPDGAGKAIVETRCAT
ncbi:MAG: carboxypeptidase regulatory-like domain-containing protein, partial [Acidobacteria bacterium]|nr:carboxypeptidase regulatory-like domain-containing protein [Acidobacteriota bacterium]